MAAVTESYAYHPFTGTGNVKTIPATMGGITFATGGTVAVYDDAGTTAGDLVLATTAVSAGQYLALPTALAKGLYLVCGGGATGTVWAN